MDQDAPHKPGIARPAQDMASGRFAARRAALRRIGSLTVGAAAVLMAAQGLPKRAVAASVGTLPRRRRSLGFAGRVRWASWTEPEFYFSDGWDDWDTIQNRGKLPILHENFQTLQPTSKLPHHWIMVVDLRRCVGCQACVVACKSENNVAVGVYRTFVQVQERGDMVPSSQGDVLTDRGPLQALVQRLALPRLCNHCDDPPCVEVCPVQATYKRQDGPVLIHYEKCIGCGFCINACPYNARYFNPIQQTADKCTFCVQRLDRGLLPSCVTSCVGRARIFGDLNDPQSAVAQILAQYPVATLKPELGTMPQVFYVNLDGSLAAGDIDSSSAIYPYAVGEDTQEFAFLAGSTNMGSPTGGDGGM